ncbi:MAG TPA: hypothetical protein PKE12_02025 [Kiritimatiellia bacterium]|nr:hypothetical protein [Kiritimatiellia bacterium]
MDESKSIVPEDPRENRDFVDEARKIIESASYACNDTPLAWPLTKERGEYSEVWISEVLKRIQLAFDPNFYRCRPQPDANSETDLQAKVDAEVEQEQRRLAQTLWAQNRDLAVRLTDILQKTEKPPGLPLVESGAHIVETIADLERRQAHQTSISQTLILIDARLQKLNQTSITNNFYTHSTPPKPRTYPRQIGVIRIEDEHWTDIRVLGTGIRLEQIRPQMKSVIEAMDDLGAIGVINSKHQDEILKRADIRTKVTIRAIFSDNGESPDSYAGRCRLLGKKAVLVDKHKRHHYYVAERL